MASRFTFETADGSKQTVTTVSGDYFHVNRALAAEGISTGDVTVFEYQHRLAHRAGQRLGLVPADLDFLTWADTVAEFSDEPEADDEGEAPATPA